MSRVYEDRMVKTWIGRDPDERKALDLVYVSPSDLSFAMTGGSGIQFLRYLHSFQSKFCSQDV